MDPSLLDRHSLPNIPASNIPAIRWAPIHSATSEKKVAGILPAGILKKDQGTGDSAQAVSIFEIRERPEAWFFVP
jgi:hypothetical protein